LFAVAAVDDLVEQAGIGRVVLFETIEADLIDQEKFGREIGFQFLFQGVVGQAGEEVAEHAGGGDVTAAEILGAADQQQGLGDMAFAFMQSFA